MYLDLKPKISKQVLCGTFKDGTLSTKLLSFNKLETNYVPFPQVK